MLISRFLWHLFILHGHSFHWRTQTVDCDLPILQGSANEQCHRVSRVEPGGPADVAGIKKGDRVLSVNGVTVAGEAHEFALAAFGLSLDGAVRLPTPLHYDPLPSFLSPAHFTLWPQFCEVGRAVAPCSMFFCIWPRVEAIGWPSPSPCVSLNPMVVCPTPCSAGDHLC